MKTYNLFWTVLNVFFFLSPGALASSSEINLESVQGGSQKIGTIQKTFNATKDELWSAVMDIEHYNEFMPKNKMTKILERTNEKIRYHALVNMPWPISDVEYDSDVFPQPKKNTIVFHMVEGTGKGVKNFYGHWLFSPESAHVTHAIYVLYFEADRHYPQWVVNMGLKSTLGQVMKNVEKRIEKQRTIPGK